MLAGSLIKRMRLDLTTFADDDDVGTLSDAEDDQNHDGNASQSRRWIAHPRTLRLSTRPRPPLNPDGTRPRTFTRISKSGSMPSFVFSLITNVDVLSDKLVEETLMPLFRKLHPEKSGWNLSLVNICATSMSMTAGDSKDGAGRDISRMFRRQKDVLKDWKVEDVDMAPSDDEDGFEQQPRAVQEFSEDHRLDGHCGSEDLRQSTQESYTGDDAWDSGEDNPLGDACRVCGAVMPSFAMLAHERFHSLPD